MSNFENASTSMRKNDGVNETLPHGYEVDEIDLTSAEFESLFGNGTGPDYTPVQDVIPVTKLNRITAEDVIINHSPKPPFNNDPPESTRYPAGQGRTGVFGNEALTEFAPAPEIASQNDATKSRWQDMTIADTIDRYERVISHRATDNDKLLLARMFGATKPLLGINSVAEMIEHINNLSLKTSLDNPDNLTVSEVIKNYLKNKPSQTPEKTQASANLALKEIDITSPHAWRNLPMKDFIGLVERQEAGEVLSNEEASIVQKVCDRTKIALYNEELSDRHSIILRLTELASRFNPENPDNVTIHKALEGRFPFKRFAFQAAPEGWESVTVTDLLDKIERTKRGESTTEDEILLSFAHDEIVSNKLLGNAEEASDLQKLEAILLDLISKTSPDQRQTTLKTLLEVSHKKNNEKPISSFAINAPKKPASLFARLRGFFR